MNPTRITLPLIILIFILLSSPARPQSETSLQFQTAAGAHWWTLTEESQLLNLKFGGIAQKSSYPTLTHFLQDQPARLHLYAPTNTQADSTVAWLNEPYLQVQKVEGWPHEEALVQVLKAAHVRVLVIHDWPHSISTFIKVVVESSDVRLFHLQHQLRGEEGDRTLELIEHHLNEGHFYRVGLMEHGWIPLFAHYAERVMAVWPIPFDYNQERRLRNARHLLQRQRWHLGVSFPPPPEISAGSAWIQTLAALCSLNDAVFIHFLSPTTSPSYLQHCRSRLIQHTSTDEWNQAVAGLDLLLLPPVIDGSSSDRYRWMTESLKLGIPVLTNEGDEFEGINDFKGAEAMVIRPWNSKTVTAAVGRLQLNYSQMTEHAFQLGSSFEQRARRVMQEFLKIDVKEINKEIVQSVNVEGAKMMRIDTKDSNKTTAQPTSLLAAHRVVYMLPPQFQLDPTAHKRIQAFINALQEKQVQVTLLSDSSVQFDGVTQVNGELDEWIRACDFVIFPDRYGEAWGVWNKLNAFLVTPPVRLGIHVVGTLAVMDMHRPDLQEVDAHEKQSLLGADLVLVHDSVESDYYHYVYGIPLSRIQVVQTQVEDTKEFTVESARSERKQIEPVKELLVALVGDFVHANHLVQPLRILTNWSLNSVPDLPLFRISLIGRDALSASTTQSLFRASDDILAQVETWNHRVSIERTPLTKEVMDSIKSRSDLIVFGSVEILVPWYLNALQDAQGVVVMPGFYQGRVSVGRHAFWWDYDPHVDLYLERVLVQALRRAWALKTEHVEN